MKIENNVFIVTGGASGLGESVVRSILAQGGVVSVFDMQKELGEKLEEEFKGKLLFNTVNVTDEDSVSKAIEATIEKFGSLRGVVNCAGVGSPMRVISSNGKVHTLDHFNKVIGINLLGTFNVLRLAASAMSKLPAAEDGERGTIVNVASVAAYEGQIGQAAYSASKGGVVAMTLPIARELGKLGIRVNTIAPGIFLTPMMRGFSPKVQESLVKQVPFPARLGDPNEFAELVSHIIENRYINGTCIRIDGSIRMSSL